MCGSFETELKQKFKWLGQILSYKGISDSVSETVRAREGKIRGACLEISHIINDWRSKVSGGMATALTLWEACCIPSLLHGAGTWTEISPAIEKSLNQLQCWYLKLIYQVGPGAPSASLLWDTNVLDMSLRIWKEKLLFVLHLRNLEEKTLARTVYEEQKRQRWPGLAIETENICQQLCIEDCNTTTLNKLAYKKILTKALHRKNEEMLRTFAQGKCERIGREEYGRKDYIDKKNIYHIRQQYRSRFGLQPFSGNYPNDKRYSMTGGLCRCKEAREEESHLLSGQCKVFGDLAEGFSDFSNDESLVQLFSAVLDRRDQLDKYTKILDEEE